MSDNDFILDYEDTEGEYELATINQRFTNRFVDSIVIGIVVFLLVGYFPELNNLTSWENNSILWRFRDYIHDLFQMLFYYSAFEFLLGQSLGKMLTQTKVVTVDGQKPTFDKILLRSLCRSIPFNAISFLFKDDGTGWHDTLSGTRVVQQ